MGTILPGERGTVVPIEGELPEGVLGEVKVHQQVYRRRKDVGAVCRVFPPNVMTMSVLNKRPVSRHGLSAFFFPQPAFWNDVSLMRTDALAASVADAIGLTPGIMLRGNGAIVAGSNMAQCLSLCMYLEEMCRVELGVLASGTEADPIPLDSTEARNRSDWNGRVEQRMWDHLTFKDPE
jgi:HCOMODA/2-hydroxy-3-carboxy-muconic semialdehyde decarboxylase